MPANEVLAIGMFLSFILLVFTGFPVAWILGGLAVIFSALSLILEADFSIQTGLDWNYTSLSVERIWNVMENWVMVALPMFIMMGLLLDRSGIANDLMRNFSKLFGGIHGGLAISVALIGLLLAASTGIIVRRLFYWLSSDCLSCSRRATINPSLREQSAQSELSAS